MGRRARLCGLILVGLIALLLTSCGTESDIRIGQIMPAFKLSSLDGSSVSSASFRGQPLIINFWATWCGPCRYEIPTLRKIARQTSVTVIGITIDSDDVAAIRAFAESHAIDYPVLLGDRELAQRFGVRAIPYTLVVDSSHNIVSMHTGVVSERVLERDLQRLGK